MRKQLLGFVLLNIFNFAAQAKDGIESTIFPNPPYAPGTKVKVTISGPGMNSLQDHAYFRLRGKGATDFIHFNQVWKQGNPPIMKWSFIAPEWANTLTPQIEAQVRAKNGADETLTAANTPSFAQVKFSGIKVDITAPELSNFQFSQPAAGRAQLTFDVKDSSKIKYQGGGMSIAGHAYSGLDVACRGSAPAFKCTGTMNIPVQAQGKIEIYFGIGDLAGNRTDVSKTFPLAKITDVDASKPKIIWPVTTVLCKDSIIRFNFEINGGAGFNDGTINVWAKSQSTIAAGDQVEGIATQSNITCDGQKCKSYLEAPVLIGLQKGGLTATVGNTTSTSNVGGRATQSELRFSVDGKNGHRTEHLLSASTVSALLSAIPTSGKTCRTVELSEKGALSELTMAVPAGAASGTTIEELPKTRERR